MQVSRHLPIPYAGITHSPYIQELVVRARQLDSGAQGPIGPIVAAAPGLKIVYNLSLEISIYKTPYINQHLSLPRL